MKFQNQWFALPVLAGFLTSAPTLFATTYSGNGDTGFGGPIGNGSLSLTDDGTTLFGTLSKGLNNFNDVLVVYVDSAPGGFSSTAGFGDANDGLRKAISGFDGGASRSTLTFAGGFSPDYALALGPSSDNFGGVWSLANGGGNSLGYAGSANLSPVGNAAASTYTFSVSLALLGLTPGNGQSLELFGTYISNTGYRSTESMLGNDSGSQGYNNFTQTSFVTYTTTPVPEPATGALAASGVALFYLIRRRR